MKRIFILAVSVLTLGAGIALGEVSLYVDSTGFDVESPEARYKGNMAIYFSEEAVLHLVSHNNGIGIMCAAIDEDVLVTVNSSESVISVICGVSAAGDNIIEVGEGTVLHYSRPVSQGFSDAFNETDIYKSTNNVKIFLAGN